MGWVNKVAPVVLGIAKKNKTLGNLAYKTVAGTAKAQKVLVPGATKVLKTGGKALPYIGAGITAADAYGNYNEAINQGQDPGRAAFRGIGQTLGGFTGGALGSTVGPLGTAGGYFGGSMAGGAAADAAWDAMTGGPEKPVNYRLSQQEQMALIQKRRQRQQVPGQVANSSMAAGMPTYDLGGFKYSQGVDPSLVAFRLQQQAQNINAVQGYSVAKHLSNNQLKGQLGQQYTDRFGIGQMSQTERSRIMQENLTARYGIGKKAEVENNRTRRDTTLGLGAQYTQRYGVSRMYDSQDRQTASNERLGLGQQYNQRYGIARNADNERYRDTTTRELGFRDYDLRERERQDKRFLTGRSLDNQYDIGVLSALQGFYR